jgi:hypothetical protein
MFREILLPLRMSREKSLGESVGTFDETVESGAVKRQTALC